MENFSENAGLLPGRAAAFLLEQIFVQNKYLNLVIIEKNNELCYDVNGFCLCCVFVYDGVALYI